MADMEEVYSALRAADAAGDTASVIKLSEYIQQTDTQPQAAPVVEPVVEPPPEIQLDQLPESKPMVAGESISTITGQPVTDAEIRQGGATPETQAQNKEMLDIAAPMGGLLAGGVVGGVPGAVLGYAGGKSLARGYGEATGQEEQLEPAELATETGKDLAEGAVAEMGGQIAGKAITGAVKVVGEAAKSILGKTTGTGKAAIEEAIKSGKIGDKLLKSATDYDKALRGKISGEDIVDTAKQALVELKDIRGAKYTKDLEKIKLSPEKLTGVRNALEKKLRKLISPDRFDIKPVVTDKGMEFDFSNSTLVEGQPVVNKALNDIAKWDDFTAKGMDILKRRLGTYADQAKRGTPAESFLTQLARSLGNGLKKEVPGYAKMTKGYAEATTLIKDIESGMLLKKEGMSGRIRADMTLRRIMSSMRDNNELRKDLVMALSSDTTDLVAQTAGYSMRSPVPLGISGSGAALIGEVALVKMNPAMWPVLAASSPRVSGEFLRLFGKTLSKIEGTAPLVGRAAVESTQSLEGE